MTREIAPVLTSDIGVRQCWGTGGPGTLTFATIKVLFRSWLSIHPWGTLKVKYGMRLNECSRAYFLTTCLAGEKKALDQLFRLISELTSEIRQGVYGVSKFQVCSLWQQKWCARANWLLLQISEVGTGVVSLSLFDHRNLLFEQQYCFSFLRTNNIIFLLIVYKNLKITKRNLKKKIILVSKNKLLRQI